MSGSFLESNVIFREIYCVLAGSKYAGQGCSAQGILPVGYDWIGFFIALAILNEIIWRTQSTDLWVNFKVFGILPITFIFTLMQFSTIKKYQIEE